MENHLFSMSSLEHRASLTPIPPDPATLMPAQTGEADSYGPVSSPVATPATLMPPQAVLNGPVTPYMGPNVEPEPEAEPEPRSNEHLRPVRLHLVHLLCFLLTFIIYVAFIPQFIRYSSPPTGDQPF